MDALSNLAIKAIRHYSIFRRKMIDWSLLTRAQLFIAYLFFMNYKVLYLFNSKLALDFLLKAHRIMIRLPSFVSLVSCLRQRLEKAIAKEQKKDWNGYNTINTKKTVTDREIQLLRLKSIVLKKPKFEGDLLLEKGVLLLKFTDQFRIFRCCIDAKRILEHYYLILEPSWSGYANYNILYFTKFRNFPIIVMATEKKDYEFLDELRSNLIPVKFGASDWVDPRIFHPVNCGKKYDAVMVASWARHKRHHVLFDAVRRIQDPSYQLALIGFPWKGSRREIENLLHIYNITKRVTIFEDLKPSEVNIILNESKVNVLLTIQEGSNKSLFEGFFANVPGIALKNNVGIQKEYFNSHTGILISENNLSKELLFFRDHWDNFNPRMWAEANISPEVTRNKLNNILKKVAIENGEQWSTDIVIKCNSPALRYYSKNDKEQFPSIQEVLKTYAA